MARDERAAPVRTGERPAADPPLAARQTFGSLQGSPLISWKVQERHR